MMLHAASLAYAGTGDPALRAKLDRVVAALIATQEPDGYLGTYVADKRFGLYRVDFDTLRRTPKLSAAFYRNIIARNAVDV